MRVSSLALMLALGFGSLATAHAANSAAVDEQLAAARAAIAAGDYKAATRALDAAHAAAPGVDAVLPARTLARISFYRGVVEHLQGDKKGKAIEHWRQSLVFENSFKWETEVLNAQDPETLYEALRSEVRSRSKLDVGVPEKTGAAKLFVDGQRKATGETVLQGEHLAQITCPDGVTRGVWTDFSKPVKWFGLCPGGVDTSVVVADTAVEDEWSEFGPSFGSPVVGGEQLIDVPYTEEAGEPGATAEAPAPPVEATVATAPAPSTPAPSTPAPPEVVAPATPVAVAPATPAPAPVVATPPATPVVSATDEFDVPKISLATGPDEPEPTPQPAVEAAAPVVASAPTPPPVIERPAEKVVETPKVVEQPKVVEPPAVAAVEPPRVRGEGPGAGVFMLAGGGAMLAGGAVANFVLVNPAWSAIEAAREDPQSVTRAEADALTGRFNTFRGVTLGLLGGGAALAGVGVALDSSLTPYVMPGTIGLRGRF